MMNFKKDSFKDIGIFLLRLFIGLRLIYGVIDNIISWEKMQEFAGFLESFGFPFPIICAIVSVYTQFLAGILVIVGYKIRMTSFFLIVNFGIALLVVHQGDSIERMTPALAMLFGSLTFFFYGAGRYAFKK